MNSIAQGEGSSSVLHVTAVNANEGMNGVFRLLLENGANTNSALLKRAVEKGNEAAVYLLLENGAIATTAVLRQAAAQENEAIVRSLLDSKENVENDWDYDIALRLAAGNGHETVVRLLLENGAVATGLGLITAAKNGFESIVRLLLENGADVNVKEGDGRTALHWAAMKRNEVIVRLLLDKEAQREELTKEAKQFIAMLESRYNPMNFNS